MQKKLFLYSAGIVVFVFILNKLANLFYWYSSIPQFDMLMHALGGVFIAVWVSALLYPLLRSHHGILWAVITLASVLIVGFLWEVFEFSVQGVMRVETLANIPDSLSDMVFDLIGGVLGVCFVLWKRTRYNQNNGIAEQNTQ